MKGSRDKLKNEIELLNTTKDKISDLVSYDGSSHTSTVMDYNFLMNQLKNLDSSITQYESNHASQDLVAFKELLAATKALITEHAGKTRTIGTYQSGDFAKLKSVQRFAIAYKQATQQMESRVERVKAAQERDKVRFEALAAEDRAKNGWKELGLGVLTVAIGILAIIGTLGTATPLVVAGGIVGFGTTAYGLSNAAEGVHNIVLGNAGDAHTKSYNLIRDTLFMGNDKLYHDVGNVFVTASAIMIPIGQTQSVVKGLTQFAIGEAGAYTAGQVAYHGTKLLGGSEEDAQTANFIGNLVGGYVTSSAASKFSLNKVKNNLSEPNFANYREFSTRKFGDFKTNFQDVETKITVETRNAAGEIQRIQLKAVGIDETGKIRIQDYTTAKDGLSIKRQDSLDNLSKYGGTVVGEGKGRFTGGTKIEPGTRIEIISQKTSDISIEHVSPEIKKATFAKFRELASKEIDWNTPEKQASFEDTFDMYVERAVREGAAPNKEALYKMYQTRQYDYPKAYKDAIKQPYLKGGASSVVSGDNVKNFAFNNGKTVGRMDGGVGRGNFTTSIVEDSTLLYDKSGNLKSGSEIATVKGVRNDTYDSGMFQYEYSPELVKNMDKEGLIQFPNGDTPGSSSLNIPGAKTWAGSDIKMSESELLMPTIDMQGHSYDEFLYAIKKQGYYEIKNPTVVVPGENTTIDIEGIFRINQWSK
ncbi:hypothetical protein [Streptococcus oralis]|uniref:hypothetical protein n=2 Tax=Streptococcus oralis TaxID=1303 RepID=UPI0011568294|nr:hypothetical protein [Streptococcus oralis]